MAGEAKTSAFMLSEATVMIGPQTDLFKLNPTNNSIGLVKNFNIMAEPTYTDLSQGTRNHLVYSVLTDNKVKATMEVFEYTGTNLAYGLGLDGSSISTITSTLVTSTLITGDGTIASVVVTAATDVHTSYPAGAWVYLLNQNTDQLHLTRVATGGATYSTGTLTVPLVDPVPVGLTFPVGASFSLINQVPVGQKINQPFFSSKIVGIMPNGEPLVVLIPKIRIIKGFSVMFANGGQNQYGNLPFEFQPYELVTTDPNYALYAGKGFASVLTRQ